MNRFFKLLFSIAFILGLVGIIYIGSELKWKPERMGLFGAYSLAVLAIGCLLCIFYRWAVVLTIIAAIIHFLYAASFWWMIDALAYHGERDPEFGLFFFSYIFPVMVLGLAIIEGISKPVLSKRKQ